MDDMDKSSLDNLSQPQDMGLLSRLLTGAGQGISRGFERFREGVSGEIGPTTAQRIGIPQASGLTLDQLQLMLGNRRLDMEGKPKPLSPEDAAVKQSVVGANRARAAFYLRASGAKKEELKGLLERAAQLDRETGWDAAFNPGTSQDDFNAALEEKKKVHEKIRKLQETIAPESTKKSKANPNAPANPHPPGKTVHVFSKKHNVEAWITPVEYRQNKNTDQLTVLDDSEVKP